MCLPRGAVGWSGVCDYGSSCSRSLTLQNKTKLSSGSSLFAKVPIIQRVHARIQKFFARGGPTLTTFFFFFFFFDEGIQIPLEAGQHRPASETPFKFVLLSNEIRTLFLSVYLIIKELL